MAKITIYCCAFLLMYSSRDLWQNSLSSLANNVEVCGKMLRINCHTWFPWREPKWTVLSYSWQKRLPTCVDLFPEQTDTSGRVKLSILHLSSTWVFLTKMAWPVVSVCSLMFATSKRLLQSFTFVFYYNSDLFKIFLYFSRHFNKMQSFTFIFYYISDLFKIFSLNFKTF